MTTNDTGENSSQLWASAPNDQTRSLCSPTNECTRVSCIPTLPLTVHHGSLNLTEIECSRFGFDSIPSTFETGAQIFLSDWPNDTREFAPSVSNNFNLASIECAAKSTTYQEPFLCFDTESWSAEAGLYQLNEEKRRGRPKKTTPKPFMDNYFPYHPEHLWCPECQKTYAAPSCPIHSISIEEDCQVMSYARLSTPACLKLVELESRTRVLASKRLQAWTRFGPVIAPLISDLELQEHPEWLSRCPFRADILGGNSGQHSIQYFKLGDENVCNWMMFVRRLSRAFVPGDSEANCVVYQGGHGGQIYFMTTEYIRIGRELAVAFAPPYARHCELTVSYNQVPVIPTLTSVASPSLPQIHPDEFHCFRCNITFHLEDAFMIHCLGHPDELAERGFVQSTADHVTERDPLEPPESSHVNSTKHGSNKNGFIELFKPHNRIKIQTAYFRSRLRCSLCGAESSGISELVQHTNSQHSVSKPRIFNRSKRLKCLTFESTATDLDMFENFHSVETENRVNQLDISEANSKDVEGLTDTGERLITVDLRDPSVRFSDKRLWAYGCGICGHHFTNRMLLFEHKELNHSQIALSTAGLLDLVDEDSVMPVGLDGIDFTGATQTDSSTFAHNVLDDLTVEASVDQFSCLVGDSEVESRFDENIIPSRDLLNILLDFERSEKPRADALAVALSGVTMERPECSLCGLEFKTRSALAVHLRSHNRSTITATVTERQKVCNVQTRSSTRPKLNVSSASGFFQCHVCGESQPNQAAWRKHGFIHRRASDHMYPCLVCPSTLNRVYATFVQLQRHMRHVHSNKIFPCPHCNRTFGRRAGLVRHLAWHSAKLP